MWFLRLAVAVAIPFVLGACGGGGPTIVRTASPTATPTGTLAPTPTRTVFPGPASISVTSTTTAVDREFETSVVVANIPPPGVVGFTVELTYDSSIVNIVSATGLDPGWGNVAVNIRNEEGLVRLVGARVTGVTGASSLATLVVKAVGASGTQAALILAAVDLIDSDLKNIPVGVQDGTVTIE